MSMTGERPGAWPERVVAAVAGVGRLSGNWKPAPRGWGNATVETVEIGRTTASCLFVGSYSAILGVAVEGCDGLTEVLAAGVTARTWVGPDISG